MTVNRASIKKQLQEGINAVFGLEYRQHPEEWSQVFDTFSSSKAFEEDVLMYGLGYAPMRDEGSPLAYDEGGEAWTARYTHWEVASGFRITKQAIEDGLYGNLGSKFGRALARSMRQTKEVLHANVLNNAFSSSFPGGDGVAIISGSHPTARAGNQSNVLATPADLSETAIEQLAIQIRRAKDDRGLPVNLAIDSLVIPPELEFEAIRLTRSILRPGTGDNDVNAMVSKGLFRKAPVVMTHLTDPDVWLIKTDCPDGLKHFKRIGMQRGMEGDYETDDMRYKSRERFSAGVTDWRSIWGSQGST